MNKVMIAVSVIATIALALWVAVHLRDREYFVTEFYADTGIVPKAGEDGSWRYGPKQGHVTLVLLRGRPHATFTTKHGWWERLSIEWPSQPTLGRFNVNGGMVTVGYTRGWDRVDWKIGDEGIRGTIEVESVTGNLIVASYDVAVDTLMLSKRREVRFEGRSTFHRQTPEEGIAASHLLFPK